MNGITLSPKHADAQSAFISPSACDASFGADFIGEWLGEPDLRAALERAGISNAPLPHATSLLSGGFRCIGIVNTRMEARLVRALLDRENEWSAVEPQATVIRGALQDWAEWVLRVGVLARPQQAEAAVALVNRIVR